jgi:hypothetical protein
LPLELFTSGEARWLGIQVQGQPEQARVLLVSVPYALRAEEAQRLAGREASEFLLAEQLESDVQEVVETKVVEELEAQGLVSTEDGVTRTITDGASTFTDNNSTQVVLVEQQGSGMGLRGRATAGTGNTIGVQGEASSTAGARVKGFASSPTGVTFGVLALNSSTSGRAFFGRATALTGVNFGFLGQSDSTSGTGVKGFGSAGSGSPIGVLGVTVSPGGRGVFGQGLGGVGATPAERS